MAADQRRKRMNSANVIGFSSREHYRAKRKKIGSSPDGALRSGDHISLEWDRNRSKVVSKKEQVGLSFRHLREFVDVVPPRRNILAQVCPVPHETFQLENLSEVLSNEVWRSSLSDGERNYLRQFLPDGVDVEQVVQSLLDGDNFHFGNPFLDWGSDVCSSKAHPDQIVSREEGLRADKRRYYSDLEKYHHDIIDYLQTLKEKWETSKDPEKDVVNMMCGRSRGASAHVNGSCQDLTATSESSSGTADEKPYSSDNKISSVVRTGEVQRRPKSSAVEKEKSQSPLIARDNVVNAGVKARKKDTLPKHSIQQTDGAKYMSYLKISKKQHQIVTSMKQSGKSIQSRALNRILGSINNLDVQPYGVFVEEEEKKLNAHWLQLVKDLPAAYAIWQKLQLQKSSPSPCSPSRCHGLIQTEVEANDYSSSIQGQSLPQASFPSEPHATILGDANPVGKHSVSDLENASSDQRIPCITSSHGEGSQFCSGGDVWEQVGGIRQSYISRQAYAPSGGLSIIHHPEGDEAAKNCFIDLESNMPEEVDRRKMLQRKANNSFGSFPSNDQNELLQSLFNGQGVASRTTEQLHSLLKVPHNEEHKQIMGIGFHQEGSNNLMESSQFSGQFHDQIPAPHALSHDQQRQIDVYGQGSMSDNIYSNGRGFMMQRPDWNPNCAQIGVTPQPRLSTGPLLNQNWHFKSMWANTNGVGCTSQGSQIGTERDPSLLRVVNNAEQIVHRGSTSDQSLFSVLSQCSQLRHSRSAFEPESSSDQVVAPGNYGMLMGGGTNQVGSNLVQPANPLDYLSGSNPVTSLMPDDVAWMNQSRQNSGLHDPLGKLYPRSWNP
ncbi:PREDICTED: uncharacterized protein LOC104737981 [Camelina sativa]|uniref:Uncharacterized protein LOC104737981 n=1 Tax=Camelina sativa TaxID=90675 RepID=A0ABM0VI50_CAMSA|nr:PREDICTED: uncharacterized protein LOC104737981 [Camelina sativa]